MKFPLKAWDKILLFSLTFYIPSRQYFSGEFYISNNLLFLKKNIWLSGRSITVMCATIVRRLPNSTLNQDKTIQSKGLKNNGSALDKSDSKYCLYENWR